MADTPGAEKVEEAVVSTREIIVKSMIETAKFYDLARTAAHIESRLAAAGYRILEPGELDPETLEAAANVAEQHAKAKEEYGDSWDAGIIGEVVDAIRALNSPKDSGESG